MDKLKLLQERKRQLLDAGKDVRAQINSLVDENSFVELSAFSFSESQFYGDRAEGEGVVCGFATLDDVPYYIIAQNAAVLDGGISKANCEKMIKCLEQAEKNEIPVIYLMSTLGVRVGEGVDVLEGIAGLLLKASRLRDTISQYLIVNGEVYGQIALLAGICDCNFFIDKKSVLALTSPLVLSASSGQNLSKDKVGGASALNKTGLTSFVVKDLSEARAKIGALHNLLRTPIIDCEELNNSLPSLNKKADAKAILNVFDKGTLLEISAGYCTEIRTYLGRIGGIAVAAVVFDGNEGVKLCQSKMMKLNEFAYFASCYNLPYLTFVNTLGVEEKLEVNNSPVATLIADFIYYLDSMESAKISVVFGKAIGLGYTLFASKSIGYDFVYAFANSEIALFDNAQGAEIELAGTKKADSSKLAEVYANEKADAFNAARGGYIDNIIEPAFVRQYLIASLQTFIK